MEVILLQDVKTLGKKGEKVSVSDGYARNYILPKKLGIEANATNLNNLKLQKANEARMEKKMLEEAQALAAKIQEKSVTVKMKCGEGGRTFGSISTKEIVAAAKQQLHIELDKKKMQLKEPIRSLGNYIIPVKVHKDVTAQLTVKVIEE